MTKLVLPDGRGAAEDEFLLELAPGRLLYLFYTDDPGVWHAAVLVYPAPGGWQILTPDGDVYNEDVMCVSGEGCARAALAGAGGKPPKGIVGKLYKLREAVADSTLLVYMDVFKEQGGVPAPKRYFDQKGVAHSWPITNPEAESDPAVKKARMFATKTPLGKDLSGGN